MRDELDLIQEIQQHYFHCRIFKNKKICFLNTKKNFKEELKELNWDDRQLLRELGEDKPKQESML